MIIFFKRRYNTDSLKKVLRKYFNCKRILLTKDFRLIGKAKFNLQLSHIYLSNIINIIYSERNIIKWKFLKFVCSDSYFINQTNMIKNSFFYFIKQATLRKFNTTRLQWNTKTLDYPTFSKIIQNKWKSVWEYIDHVVLSMRFLEFPHHSYFETP